jgi:hypothetical protein
MHDPKLLLLDPADNVLVAIQTLEAGDTLTVDGQRVNVPARLTLGHKLAARAIRAGEKILKYRVPIGSATQSDYIQTFTLESGQTFSTKHDHH